MIRYPVALAAVALSACSFAPRAPFVPPPAPAAAAQVYFYRPSEMTARLRTPTITANGTDIGKLSNDSYAVAEVPPGLVQIRSRWAGLPGASRDDSLTVSPEAGQRRFVRVRYYTGRPKALGGGLSFEDRPGLEEVAEAEAVPQMAGMERAAGK